MEWQCTKANRKNAIQQHVMKYVERMDELLRVGSLFSSLAGI